MTAAATGWLGQSVERIEGAALLTGNDRFLDDLGVRVSTLEAAVQIVNAVLDAAERLRETAHA
jgi:hypothetical protein